MSFQASHRSTLRSMQHRSRRQSLQTIAPRKSRRRKRREPQSVHSVRETSQTKAHCIPQRPDFIRRDPLHRRIVLHGSFSRRLALSISTILDEISMENDTASQITYSCRRRRAAPVRRPDTARRNPNGFGGVWNEQPPVADHYACPRRSLRGTLDLLARKKLIGLCNE